MHPIERLRYVARSQGMPQTIQLRETASAMMSFADDPASLLTACRRMVSRQPESGPQVTLASRLLTAPNPREAAWNMVEEMEEDRTDRAVINALPEDGVLCVVGWPELIGNRLTQRGDIEVLLAQTDSSSWGAAEQLLEMDVQATDVDPPGLGAAAAAADVTVIEAVAAGPDEVLARAGSLAAAAAANVSGRQVWLTTPVGTVLPQKMWTGLIGRHELKGEPWELDYETVPMHVVAKVFGPAGELDPADIMKHSSCPVAPELFA